MARVKGDLMMKSEESPRKPMTKPILDACCGGRMFWFDKKNPNAVFCDIRCETYEYQGTEQGRVLEINPDIIADFRNLPFEDNTFFHIVYDPPHYTWNGKNSRMSGIYGTVPAGGGIDYIADGFKECMRVLRPFGTLIFKWNDLRISSSKVIKAFGQDPLYGHKSGKASNTHWMAFMKMV